jgi:hypothetical protein
VNTCAHTEYVIVKDEDLWTGCDITPEEVTYQVMPPYFWIGSLDESDDERHPPQLCEDVSVIEEDEDDDV